MRRRAKTQGSGSAGHQAPACLTIESPPEASVPVNLAGCRADTEDGGARICPRPRRVIFSKPSRGPVAPRHYLTRFARQWRGPLGPPVWAAVLAGRRRCLDFRRLVVGALAGEESREAA